MANFNVTIPGARVSPLLKHENGNLGAAVRYLVYGADLAVAAATGITDTVTLILGTTPKNFVYTMAFAYVSAAFAGPGGLTVQLGVTAAPAGLIPALTAQATGFKGPANGIYAVSTNGVAATQLIATFTSSVSGGPAAITGGVLEIVVGLIDLDRLY